MPYTQEHKAKTRERIVGSAWRLFNRHGFAGVSIDEIMADAGLTRGGFYNHFATKDELYAEVVTFALASRKEEVATGACVRPVACANSSPFISRRRISTIARRAAR